MVAVTIIIMMMTIPRIGDGKIRNDKDSSADHIDAWKKEEEEEEGKEEVLEDKKEVEKDVKEEEEDGVTTVS